MPIDVQKSRELMIKYFPNPLRIVMIEPYLETIERSVPLLNERMSLINDNDSLNKFLDEIINGEVFYDIVRPIKILFYENRKKYDYSFIANKMVVTPESDTPTIEREMMTVKLNAPTYLSIQDTLDLKRILTVVKLIYIFTNETLHTLCPEFKLMYDYIDEMLELDRILQIKYRSDCSPYFVHIFDDFLEDFRIIEGNASKNILGIFMMNNVGIAKTVLKNIYSSEIVNSSGLIAGSVSAIEENDRLNEPDLTANGRADLWKSILHIGLFSMIAYFSVHYYDSMIKKNRK